jgi:hypothetical protein
LASIPGWRHSECALEGAIERRFRLVAHGGRDIRYPFRGRRQCLGSQSQSPSGQVRHGGLREVAGEPPDQRRPGQADFRRELGDGPWVFRSPVKQREALAHNRVSWRSDGRELFYLTLDGQLVAVPMAVRPDGRAVQPGTAAPLFHARVGAVQGIALHSYIVAADGQRFLIDKVDEQTAAPISLILNWKAPGE